MGDAIGYAVRATAMAPLDENHQALLIRLYRLAGDDGAAAAQLAACTALFEAELGIVPGIAVEAASHESRLAHSRDIADEPTIDALVEAGAAAVSAGAIDAGITSLRTAARLADGAGSTRLRIRARLILGETLIHSLGGLDEDGLASLFEVDTIALAHDEPVSAAQARAELGYVDYLRARYARAQIWLTDALELSGDSPSVRSKATTYLGGVASDQGDYPRATALLSEAVRLCQEDLDPRMEAFARSMLGRLHLLRGDLGAAADECDASIELAQKDHWLAFLPWPQAHRGEVQLRRGDLAGASDRSSRPSRGPASSGTPAGKGPQPAAWHGSPTPGARTHAPSRSLPMPAPGPPAWRIRTCGWLPTSSTPSVSSAADTAIPRPGTGSRGCRS